MSYRSRTGEALAIMSPPMGTPLFRSLSPLAHHTNALFENLIGFRLVSSPVSLRLRVTLSYLYAYPYCTEFSRRRRRIVKCGQATRESCSAVRTCISRYEASASRIPSMSSHLVSLSLPFDSISSFICSRTFTCSASSAGFKKYVH